MKLFKNSVGRPSNEVLKNRKIFIISMVALIISLIAIIISSITLQLGNNNLNKLKGAATKTFTVKYSANGGKGSMSEQTIIYGVKTNLNVNKFTKSGYKFKGWHAKRIVNNKTLYRGCKTSGTCSNEDAKWLSITSIKSYFVYKDKEEVSQTAPKGQTVTMIAQWEKTSSTTSSSSNTFSKLVSGFFKLAIKIFDKDNWNIENFTTTTRADKNKKGTIALILSKNLEPQKIYKAPIIDASTTATIKATSSNTNVLSVKVIDNNNLQVSTGLGGKATITLTSSTGITKKYEYIVSVPSGTWESNKTYIKYVESPVEGSPAVVSSNPDVISVYKKNKNEYVLKSKKEGTSTITTTFKNGEYEKESYTVKPYTYPDVSRVKSGVESTKTYNGIKVFVEKGCSASAMKNFIIDIKELPTYATNSAQAIYFLKNSTFHEVNPNHPNAVGIAHHGASSSYIDIMCDHYTTLTVAHEVGHQMDYYYGLYFDYGKISDSATYVNLYNKYKNTIEKDNTFPAGSEFFAGMYSYYFHKNIAKTHKVSSTDAKKWTISDEIVKTMEKTLDTIKKIN